MMMSQSWCCSLEELIELTVEGEAGPEVPSSQPAASEREIEGAKEFRAASPVAALLLNL